MIFFSAIVLTACDPVGAVEAFERETTLQVGPPVQMASPLAAMELDVCENSQIKMGDRAFAVEQLGEVLEGARDIVEFQALQLSVHPSAKNGTVLQVREAALSVGIVQIEIKLDGTC